MRNIELKAVLQQTGAVADKNDPAKWHTSQGVICVTDHKFFNWTKAIGGGGAIDLMMHWQTMWILSRPCAGWPKTSLLPSCKHRQSRLPISPLFCRKETMNTYHKSPVISHRSAALRLRWFDHSSAAASFTPMTEAMRSFYYLEKKKPLSGLRSAERANGPGMRWLPAPEKTWGVFMSTRIKAPRPSSVSPPLTLYLITP